MVEGILGLWQHPSSLCLLKQLRSWQADVTSSFHGKQMRKKWKQQQILFSWAQKITMDSDCIHEVKRHLHLQRKAMTNIDSILKSIDITLLTKIHIVRAMVFPVVIYEYENWTIKKAEHQRIDAF